MKLFPRIKEEALKSLHYWRLKSDNFMFSLEMVKSGLKKTKKATSTEAKAASKEKNERET